MSLKFVTVFVESIIKDAVYSVGISHQEKFIVLAGKRAKYCLHDAVCNAARLIHHKQHVILMKSLHVLCFGRSFGRCKPPFRIPVHVDFCLCPREQIAYHRRSKPLVYFGPKYIIKLLHSGCCSNYFGIRTAYNKPDD